MDALSKLLAPLTETVAQLRADKEQDAANQAAAKEAARQVQLNKDADIAVMLDNVDVDEGEDKYEKMTKRQIVEVLAGAMETALEANAVKIKSDISQSMSPGSDKVAAIEKMLMSLLANQGVQEARNEFDDFDQFREPIAKIMGEIPGVTFKRAYLLAKSEAAGDVAPKGQVETEKPTDSVWSPQAQGGVLPNQSTLQQIADRGKEARESAAVTKSGTVGIRNIISAATDKIQAAKQ